MPADSYARVLGTSAQARSSANGVRNVGNIGLRSLVGNMNSVTSINSTGTTFEATIATAADFDAVRIILAVSQTATSDAVTPTVGVSAASVSDLTDASMIGATWTNGTFGGASTTTLPPAVTNLRRSFVVSDWIPVASVARTDGGTLSLAVVRAFVSNGTTGNIETRGITSIPTTNWATHPSGRIWRDLSKTGNYATSNQSSMYPSVTTAITASPILAIQYLARGKVVSMMGFGDSITEGQQGTYYGAGPGFSSAVNLSPGGSGADGSGIAYEWADLGWSGQSMSSVMNNTIDAVAANIIPPFSLVFFPSGSPNNFLTPNPLTITSAMIQTMRGNLGVAMAQVSSVRAEPIIWTWLPSNTSVHAYGATDALRVAYNNTIRNLASYGRIVVDADSAIAGAPDGTTQIQMNASYTSDGLHPNDAGYAAIQPLYQKAIKRAVVGSPGYLSK